MPANSFNIGRDVSLDFVDPVLGPQRWAIKTGWEATPEYDEVSSKGLDGVSRHDAIPNGWRLQIDLDRGNGQLDAYFAQREAAYFNNEVVPLISVTETIQEVGGAVSVYRYTDCVPQQGATGWRGNNTTTQRITLRARRRRKVG